MDARTNQFRHALEQDVKDIFARVSIGTSGAPTLDATNSKGVYSVTRLSAGVYKFIFGSDTAHLYPFYKLLFVGARFNTAGVSLTPAAASPDCTVIDNQCSDSTKCYVTLKFSAAGTATDPASGEVMHAQFIFGDSYV